MCDKEPVASPCVLPKFTRPAWQRVFLTQTQVWLEKWPSLATEHLVSILPHSRQKSRVNLTVKKPRGPYGGTATSTQQSHQAFRRAPRSSSLLRPASLRSGCSDRCSQQLVLGQNLPPRYPSHPKTSCCQHMYLSIIEYIQAPNFFSFQGFCMIPNVLMTLHFGGLRMTPPDSQEGYCPLDIVSQPHASSTTTLPAQPAMNK